MSIFDDNFKIAFKSKSLFFSLYNLMANVPRQDLYLKEKILEITHNLLKTIFLANNSSNGVQACLEQIKSDISLLDIYLEMLYKKKYINLKQLEKEIYSLTEINKMTTKWITNMVNLDE